MTLPEFLDRLHRADLAPLRTDLLQRLVLVAEGRAKWYASGNAGGPNVRTGTYRRSITGRVVDSLHGVLGSNVRYAAFLERKDPAHGGRPNLAPAIADAKAQLPALWSQVANRWIRGLVG